MLRRGGREGLLPTLIPADAQMGLRPLPVEDSCPFCPLLPRYGVSGWWGSGAQAGDQSLASLSPRCPVCEMELSLWGPPARAKAAGVGVFGSVPAALPLAQEPQAVVSFVRRVLSGRSTVPPARARSFPVLSRLSPLPPPHSPGNVSFFPVLSVLPLRTWQGVCHRSADSPEQMSAGLRTRGPPRRRQSRGEAA